MDEQYLMGNNDLLKRSTSSGNEVTFISYKLRSNFIQAAIKYAFEFYSEFFENANTYQKWDYDKLFIKYDRIYNHAISLGLFQPGGISEKDHLNFWCLSNVLSPEMYIESGVFIGSSLHSFINSPKLKKAIAIDPNLNNLRVPKTNNPSILLINDRDFSQINIEDSNSKTLVYFDDHINTADRILQAYQKGLTYLLFDDSTGLEGICQRLYPAIPTVPMIINCHLLNTGEKLCWTWRRGNNNIGTRVSLTITNELIDKCYRAKNLIKKYAKLPDLGDFMPQPYPEKTVNTSKYLLVLDNCSS